MPLRSEFTRLPSDLGAFLFASVRDDGLGTPLSVLSALARLGLDPWAEAGRLAALPRETAAAALAANLRRLPGRDLGMRDVAPIADRLVTLLPEIGPQLPVRDGPIAAPHDDRTTSWLILVGLVILAIGNWWF